VGIHGKVREKGLHFVGTHFTRMAATVKVNVSLIPEEFLS
jgi:hypothetical protein